MSPNAPCQILKALYATLVHTDTDIDDTRSGEGR